VRSFVGSFFVQLHYLLTTSTSATSHPKAQGRYETMEEIPESLMQPAKPPSADL
jgi:hypothetical protein